MPTKPQILFIDAYDSFSNNIISLLETSLDVSVKTVKIDNPEFLVPDIALHRELSHYVAVVCGPGPGTPENQEDVGLMKKIWNLPDDKMLPVLGICLGFQSLCLEYGGIIKRLKGPQHGMVKKITHVKNSGNEKTIFHEVGEIVATLYQSLCVDIGHDALSTEDWKNKMWDITDQCPSLLPLAWVENDLSVPNNSGIADERILVAIQHINKPFWALQYHPESICANGESRKLIQNWFAHATNWNQHMRRNIISSSDIFNCKLTTEKIILDKSVHLNSTSCRTDYNSINDANLSNAQCFTRKIKLPIGMTVPEIVECTQGMQSEYILLESSNAYDSSLVRGRFSIIGLDIKKCSRIEYITGEKHLKLIVPITYETSPKIDIVDLQHFGGIWNYIATELNMAKVANGNDDSPFWGGFMGYTTYELGLESINLGSDSQDTKKKSRPDLCFVWVNSSIIIDHSNNIIYIQKIAPLFEENSVRYWMESITQKLEEHSVPVSPTSMQAIQEIQDFIKSKVQSMIIPDDSEYQSKVLTCQSYIRAGSSYELCLTDQTILNLRGLNSPWVIYKALRHSQPAPFASLIRIGSATFISASPEQFLKWNEYGQCELRPMKGTVKKSPSVSSLAQATIILNKPKEKAENLMIVDLARHDLHGICGSGNVTVPKLMVVEEYKSVFQMISVISGQIPYKSVHKDAINPPAEGIPETNGKEQDHTGLDVLAASLPPGSMTGAPKKRSCEILKKIEGKERSLYSGVVGYLDVRGRGNWSVNIRCLFKWDDEVSVNESGETTEKYHFGAGGAVTILSTPLEENEEMLAKLYGTLNIFKS